MRFQSKNRFLWLEIGTSFLHFYQRTFIDLSKDVVSTRIKLKASNLFYNPPTAHQYRKTSIDRHQAFHPLHPQVAGPPLASQTTFLRADRMPHCALSNKSHLIFPNESGTRPDQLLAAHFSKRTSLLVQSHLHSQAKCFRLDSFLIRRLLCGGLQLLPLPLSVGHERSTPHPAYNSRLHGHDIWPSWTTNRWEWAVGFSAFPRRNDVARERLEQHKLSACL